MIDLSKVVLHQLCHAVLFVITKPHHLYILY